jgi:hypothetical protein
MNSWSDLQNVLCEWSVKTFGIRGPEAPIHKLKSEVEELSRSPYSLEEYADVGILWLDAAMKAGFTAQDLLRAMWGKHRKNEKRKWGKLTRNKTFQHRKE